MAALTTLSGRDGDRGGPRRQGHDPKPNRIHSAPVSARRVPMYRQESLELRFWQARRALKAVQPPVDPTLCGVYRIATWPLGASCFGRLAHLKMCCTQWQRPRPDDGGAGDTEELRHGEHEVCKEGGPSGNPSHGSEQVSHHTRAHVCAYGRGSDCIGRQGCCSEGAARRGSRSRAHRAEGRHSQEDREPQSFASRRARQSDGEVSSRLLEALQIVVRYVRNSITAPSTVNPRVLNRPK